MSIKYKYDYSVFIGRFQPIHNAHLTIIKNALDQSEHLILVVGSYRSPLSICNPWTYNERIEMIKLCLSSEELDRITIISLRDFIYNDNAWISSLQNKISNIVKDKTVNIIGHFKDESSYYLNFFPQWDLLKEPKHGDINSTDIRTSMFEYKASKMMRELHGTSSYTNKIHINLVSYLNSFMDTDRFQSLADEYDFIKLYREKWSHAPYPPTFITTDAVVIQAGHVLLVRRKVNPGKGKLALPGGFVNQNEYIEQAVIRELKEETKIDVSSLILQNSITSRRVFDHPQRSLRGRTITHAFRLNLQHKSGPLPNVLGSDDALVALWIPFSDIPLHEEEFFEDHYHIIQYFINIQND